MDNLSKIRGIGPKTADKLRKHGADNVEEISQMSPEELKGILGWSYTKSKTTIEDARELVLDSIIEFKSVSQIKKERDEKVMKYSTGSKKLNDILGGGIETDSVTGLGGHLGSGKSQLCFTASSSCINSGRKAVYIETEPSIFRPERIIEICNGRNIDVNIDEDMYVVPAKWVDTPQKLYNSYFAIDKKIKDGMDVGLLCVDSFISPFRTYYQRRESFPDRSKMIFKHLGELQRIASEHNVAVILTTHVMSVPDEIGALKMKGIFGMEKVPVGGDSLLHSVTAWVGLERKGKYKHRAIVFDTSFLPRDETYFKIGKKGIMDV